MTKNKYEIFPLETDSEYFGIPCAKAVLHEQLSETCFTRLLENFNEYKFIQIQNNKMQHSNAQLISRFTRAFLIDVNIVMEKHLTDTKCSLPSGVTLSNNVQYDENILASSNHTHTRLIYDNELLKRGGAKMLDQKILDSFNREDRYFALSYDEKNICNGHMLYSFIDNYLQAIQISVLHPQKGIGSRIYKSLEYAARERGINLIRSGLSLSNVPSMNLHIKCGYKLVESNQTYHLWN